MRTQCKRISVQNKRPGRRNRPSPARRGRFLQAPEALAPPEILPVRAPISGQANSAKLWDCLLAAGGLINNNLNTTGAPMFSALVVLFRLVAGLVILAATWFVFDNIHDRNTEIIVAIIGLLYSFIFIISGRLQYFGLTVFSFFGRTSSFVQKIPYDDMMRDEVGLRAARGSTFLNLIFAGLIELLCLFRLFTSLLGRGWDTLSGPIHILLQSVRF
jgi:hypothetical protein